MHVSAAPSGSGTEARQAGDHREEDEGGALTAMSSVDSGCNPSGPAATTAHHHHHSYHLNPANKPDASTRAAQLLRLYAPTSPLPQRLVSVTVNTTALQRQLPTAAANAASVDIPAAC
ncbi:uncharacterized protein E0L32_005957 [Thyridium curvatum]|uniref:Uncharacterized protein n=1 Tax=Thyridium curvatum TaxID=1093900 RepID=A0A507B4Y0_9PEZI|nr:uncharacterized protein E0L32_005957 [Thyridium curvatum]TPX13754.1 hypothetical protein E0L32_005957 [Thyridium curvatum]